jgi:NitT/TauT family transport system ATP-binding protein
MSQIVLSNVTLEYQSAGGGSVRALERVSMMVRDGEFVSLVGPSGCGKSTILKLISGLLVPTAGNVLLDGQPVNGVPPSVGFMFQNDALLPWSTAIENVAVALELRGVPRPEREGRARELLAMVGLEGFERAYPSTLSGGMRKRVALARVLAYDPATYLMDEPFGALDAQTKVQMGAELLRICDGLDRTIVFVTHDIEEAIALSDRVLVMTRRPGRIKSEYKIDLPRPRDFYEVRFSREFRELHQAIWRDLAAEVAPISDAVHVEAASTSPDAAFATAGVADATGAATNGADAADAPGAANDRTDAVADVASDAPLSGAAR